MKMMKSQQAMGAYFDKLRKAAKISAPGFPELVPAEKAAPAAKVECKDGKCEVKPAAKCKDACKDDSCKKDDCKGCDCETKPVAK